MKERDHVLQPVVTHRRRKLIRWLTMLVLLIAIGAIAGGAIRFAKRRQMTECERTYRRGEYQHAIDRCIPSHKQTKDSGELVWAAEAYLALGKYDEAGALAQRLIGSPHYGAGHKILSNVLLRVTPPKPQEAKFHATAAVQAFSRTKDERGQVGASLALSQAAWNLGEYGVALSQAHEVVRLAARLGDRRNEVAGHLLQADALQHQGDGAEVEEALRRATERAQHPCDKAWIQYRTGTFHMYRRKDFFAKQAFRAAEEANQSCGHEAMKLPLELNMAWLEREQPDSALRRLDRIKAAGEEGFESLLLRAYLATDRGALDDAEAYLAETAAAELPDDDWAWNLSCGRAELAELRGGPFGDLVAEYHYRQAIERVNELRAETSTRSALLVASHRGPFDGLIALYARTGRWRDALGVVLELDASDMLRSTAADSVHGPVPTASVVTDEPRRVERRPPPSVDDVLRAWSERDLAIVIAPADRELGRKRGLERAYRMHIVAGEIRGEEVGDAGRAREWADHLFSFPEDVEIGRRLGRLMIPPSESTKTLDVLSIGELGKAPLAALRTETGEPIVARRPLARVVALRSEGSRATGTDAPVVLANPTGDLPNAPSEGRMVADQLGATARVYGLEGTPAATSARLWEAKRAEVLHIAGHVKEKGRWRGLLLADQTITPDQIVREGLAPQLAVLASCGSFAARDVEGWGSIATALLEAGTSTVIATDRTVADNTTLVLMRSFYSQPDWRVAPERALARVQGEAARSSQIPPRQWAPYTVIRRPPDPAS